MNTNTMIGKKYIEAETGVIATVTGIVCAKDNNGNLRDFVTYSFDLNTNTLPLHKFKEHYLEIVQHVKPPGDKPHKPTTHRHIAYEVVDVVDGDRIVKITEQTHRYYDFAEGDCDFEKMIFSFDGFELKSIYYPAYELQNAVCVRGKDEDRDDWTIAMPADVFLKFKEAVKAYNQEYNGDNLTNELPVDKLRRYFTQAKWIAKDGAVDYIYLYAVKPRKYQEHRGWNVDRYDDTAIIHQESFPEVYKYFADIPWNESLTAI